MALWPFLATDYCSRKQWPDAETDSDRTWQDIRQSLFLASGYRHQHNYAAVIVVGAIGKINKTK